MEVINKFKDLFFIGLVIISFSLSISAAKFYSPLELSISDLASIAVEDAVNVFTLPFESNKEHDSEIQQKNNRSMNDVNKIFLVPGIMYILSSVIMYGAIVLYIKFNNWAKQSPADKAIKLILIFLVSFMAFIFTISGLKYLIFGLIYVVIFFVVLIFLLLFSFSIIREVFQSNKSRDI